MGKIHHSFITKNLENLIIDILKSEKKKDIHISPFNRFGHSGSNLYLLSFSKEKNVGVSYLLKTFDNKKKLEREISATKQLEDKYCHINLKLVESKGPLYGFLMQNFSANPSDENSTITFKDIMYNNKYNVSKIINMTFEKNGLGLGDVYKQTEIKKCQVSKYYSKYLRNDETRKIIQSLTKDSIKNIKIDFLGKKITNPFYVKEQLLKEVINMPISLIHGDLHPDNIVINHLKHPRIVDFAWSNKNDIYIDFALFEMSVRYWNPLFYMNCQQKESLERKTLDKNFSCSDIDIDVNDEYTNKIKKMVVIIQEIRKICQNIVGDKYNFYNHLLSQFIVLYGMLKYETYNPYIVIPFLSMLGDKLIKMEYMKQ